jgi:hypothetical protein
VTKNDEEKALRSLRGHLQRQWGKRYGTPVDEAIVRSLLRPLAVRALDLRPDGSDLRALLPDIRDFLEDPGQAPKLWRELELIGQRLAAERSWIRRSDLVRELETQGFYLTPVARLRRDVQRLQEITTSNLNSPPTSLVITTPDGPVSRREETNMSATPATAELNDPLQRRTRAYEVATPRRR